MIDPHACPKCGGHNTVMLFYGLVCNTCEPVSVKAAPVIKDPSREPITYYYGWIRSDYSYDDRSLLHAKWAHVYPSHLDARRIGRVNYIIRVKTVHPISTDGTTRFRIYRDGSGALERKRDGSFHKPVDSGFEASEVGFCVVVPDTEGA